MKFIFCLAFFYALLGCSSASSDRSMTTDATSPSVTVTDNGKDAIHKVTVLEVIQVSGYSYLRVKEGETELWVAAPTINAKAGDVLYFEGGMTMTKFESKELKRTFDSIVFVDRISANPQVQEAMDTVQKSISNHGKPISSKTETVVTTGSSRDTVQLVQRIEPDKNGVSIADILKNPKAFEGKSVIVRGKVTKYTAGVMGKNWIHIQDGTKVNDKFDIVITTTETVKNGDIVSFQGYLTLNKDLGYGYFFEVLMEDAKLIK